MSTKLKAVEDQPKPEELPEFTEELPSLSIDANSFDARVAGVEPCSVIREISKRWSTLSAFDLEQEQMHERRAAREAGTPETPQTPAERWEAEQALRARKRELWLRKWEPKSDEQLEEHIQYIKRTAAQFIDWDDLGQLWTTSPRDAIELWKAIRTEARSEFVSGHYGARAFEVRDYEHSAWKRAQYLSVRDGLIEEWRPRGASEFILIDQMTQSYVMQLHWTEEAMRRSQTEPREESYEFRQWVDRQNAEAKYQQWNPGHWDIPYQHQAEAIEQAFRLADLCGKSFQRAARQLANIRLVRAKTARTRRRERAKTIRGVRVA